MGLKLHLWHDDFIACPKCCWKAATMFVNIVTTLNDRSKKKIKKKSSRGVSQLTVKVCSVDQAENHKSTQNNKSQPWRLPALQ